MTVSMLGDGIYVVAVAWQVYELSNAPTALSIVGVAWTLPMVLFLLLGGVVSDRLERRRVMIAADIARGIAIAAIGVLSLTGALELWHLVVLVGFYGVGEAFFGPAFGAIVPQIVPQTLLVEANSVSQVVRPLAHRLIGPALGGWLIAGVGLGEAFLVDAASFGVSAIALALMQARPLDHIEGARRSALQDIGEGLRFVRSQTWLWGTLVAASVAVAAFWGPVEVLVPYIVKNDLGGGADDLGLVFAAGGFGAVVAAPLLAQRGLPRRHVTFMYVVWTVATAVIAGYGFATALWQAMLVSFVSGASAAAGLVIWATLIQTLVPGRLLGRVESVDWLVSLGLVPLSFAVTGPLAEAVGHDETLIWAGAVSGVVTLLFLFVPGMRDPERRPLARGYAADSAAS
jgi:MFS family permease